MSKRRLSVNPRSTLPDTASLFIGLAVYKETIVIATAEAGRTGEVRSYGTISNDLHALEKFFAKIRKIYEREQSRWKWDTKLVPTVL